MHIELTNTTITPRIAMFRAVSGAPRGIPRPLHRATKKKRLPYSINSIIYAVFSSTIGIPSIRAYFGVAVGYEAVTYLNIFLEKTNVGINTFNLNHLGR